MKVEYDRESDVVYSFIRDGEVADSNEIEDGIIVDYDKFENVIGVEILNFSKRNMSLDDIIIKRKDVLPVLLPR